MRIAVAGVSGRMGRMLVEAVDRTTGAELVAALARPAHDWVGQDLGSALGGAARGVVVGADPEAVLTASAAEAVIDFTRPAATVSLSEAAAAVGVAHVIGTTGMRADEIARLAPAAERIAVVRAGNMSLGVNLLTQVVRQVAAALGPEFDIEVVETHHRHKVDAPSGTALMLAEAAAAGRGIDLEAYAERGRDGITGPRGAGAIGFSAIRGGDIVGEHEVMFAGPGEIVTISHRATDRALFANGAVRAALWTAGRPPGAYDMVNVLGLA